MLQLAIVGWSLAQQACSKTSVGFMSFTVHDMVMDYLKDTIDSDQQKQYHKDVVERLVTLACIVR